MQMLLVQYLVIKKTRIYYYTKKKQMYFQMIIINDLQVIIFWPSVPKLYLYHL